MPFALDEYTIVFTCFFAIVAMWAWVVFQFWRLHAGQRDRADPSSAKARVDGCISRRWSADPIIPAYPAPPTAIPEKQQPTATVLGFAPAEGGGGSETYNPKTGGPLGFQSDDVIERWEHVAALDERTCLECLILDGGPVLESPHRHEGCRCCAVPLVRADAWKRVGLKPLAEERIGRASQVGTVPLDGGLWKRYLIRRAELLRDRSYGPETGPELLAWLDAQPLQAPVETEVLLVRIREKIRAHFGHGPSRDRLTWELLYEGVDEPAPIYAVRKLDPEDEAALSAMPSGFCSPDPMIRERAPDRIAAARFNPERTYTIWIESARLSVHSKNPETARSRYELALDCFRELREAGAPGDLWERVHDTTRHLVAVYPTESLLRSAEGAIERAKKYKTAKKRIEVLKEAEAALDQGMRSGRCNADRLRPVLLLVQQAIATS